MIENTSIAHALYYLEKCGVKYFTSFFGDQNKILSYEDVTIKGSYGRYIIEGMNIIDLDTDLVAFYGLTDYEAIQKEETIKFKEVY